MSQDGQYTLNEQTHRTLKFLRYVRYDKELHINVGQAYAKRLQPFIQKVSKILEFLMDTEYSTLLGYIQVRPRSKDCIPSLVHKLNYNQKVAAFKTCRIGL